MPIIDEGKPGNALCNVRAEVEDFLGVGKTSIDIDVLIDEVVKRIHRKWHPRWTRTYTDLTIPTTGSQNLPNDFKKAIRITNQSNSPETFYDLDIDYQIQGFNSSLTDPRQQLVWITAPSAALAVRLWYYRKRTRALQDEDLVDIDEDAIDLISLGIRMLIAARSSNIEQYNMWRGEFERELQNWIDDDTEPNRAGIAFPYHKDGEILDFDSGELYDSED